MKEFMKKYIKWAGIALVSIIVLGLIMSIFGPSAEERNAKERAELESFILSGGRDRAIVKFKAIDKYSDNYKWAQDKADSLEKEQKKDNVDKLLRDLSNEIVAIKETDFKSYYNNPDRMKEGLSKFKMWANLIGKGYDKGDEKTKKLSEELEALLIKTQQRELPKFRNALARELSSKLRENNIKVTLTGKDNDILELKGATFLVDANSDKVHESYLPLFKDYRFSWVRYKSALRRDYIEKDVPGLSDKSLDLD